MKMLSRALHQRRLLHRFEKRSLHLPRHRDQHHSIAAFPKYLRRALPRNLQIVSFVRMLGVDGPHSVGMIKKRALPRKVYVV